jgi:hypothetical protein
MDRLAAAAELTGTMNSKRTWWLVALAVALFAGIVFIERRASDSGQVPEAKRPLLAGFDPIQVTRLDLGRSNRVIRVERNAKGWQLATPPYPAVVSSVENVLQLLSAATRLTTISPKEIAAQPEGLAAFGLAPPRASISLWIGTNRAQLNLGGKTLIGGQTYAQVVGSAELFVTDARLLAALPESPNDWRDPSLVVLDNPVFDRISVTNATRVFELRRDGTNRLWSLALPISLRAEGSRVQYLIQQLMRTQVSQFVTDDPRADLDAFGLQTPELSFALALGTNDLVHVLFGKSPTNDATQVYARRPGQPSIFLVPRTGLVEMLNQQFTYYRDLSLITLPPAPEIDRIDARTTEAFTLQKTPKNGWRITAPFQAGADGDLVRRFFEDVQRVAIVGFERDVVTATDLALYGLEKSARQYSFKTTVTNTAGVTNQLVAQLDFSRDTNRLDRGWAKRADENSVYAVALGDMLNLPRAAYELRDRHIWEFEGTNVSAVAVSQQGRTRRFTSDPVTGWSPDPIIRAAYDELFHRLGKLQAVAWVTRGETSFKPLRTDHKITITAKVGGETREFAIEFGKPSPSGHVYAATVFEDGQLVAFELSAELYRDVAHYLGIPAEVKTTP